MDNFCEDSPERAKGRGLPEKAFTKPEKCDIVLALMTGPLACGCNPRTFLWRESPLAQSFGKLIVKR